MTVYDRTNNEGFDSKPNFKIGDVIGKGIIVSIEHIDKEIDLLNTIGGFCNKYICTIMIDNKWHISTEVFYNSYKTYETLEAKTFKKQSIKEKVLWS